MDDKRRAAEMAVGYIEDGMTVGLGTGSTAYHAIMTIGRRVEAGLDILGVSTSQQTESLARECGIRTATLEEVDRLDLTIDGADEVDPDMRLIKGLGGALLREKIIAYNTDVEIIIVDGSKVVDRLGTRSPLPVEVLPFGHRQVRAALEGLGCDPVLRCGSERFITDGGNVIYDCHFDGIDDPEGMEAEVNLIPGVVENGLFLGLTDKVVISDHGELVVQERR